MVKIMRSEGQFLLDKILGHQKVYFTTLVAWSRMNCLYYTEELQTFFLQWVVAFYLDI